MKLAIVILFLGLFSLPSCFENTPIPVELEFSFGESWMSDSLGCDGARAKIVADSLDAFNQCKGRVLHEVFISLGYPNGIQRQNSGVVVSYFVTCGVSPKDKLRKEKETALHTNTEASKILFEADSMLVINQVRLLFP